MKYITTWRSVNNLNRSYVCSDDDCRGNNNRIIKMAYRKISLSSRTPDIANLPRGVIRYLEGKGGVGGGGNCVLCILYLSC